MLSVSAIVLDGKATREEIFVDLRARVASLSSAGVTPGLGTVIVGDDPGSHAYVRGKHRDCAAVGIALNARRIKSDYRTYVLLGDGEQRGCNPHVRSFRPRPPAALGRRQTDLPPTMRHAGHDGQSWRACGRALEAG